MRQAHAGPGRHGRVAEPPPPSRPASARRLPEPGRRFIEEEIDLLRLLIAKCPATFLVRVAGDRMLLARLHDGDLAVVERSLTPRNGGIVVVDIDGERSFKVWRRQGPRIILHDAKPRFPEFRLSPGAILKVWGVVSGSINPKGRSE